MNIRRQRFQLQPPTLTPISHITDLLVAERDNLVNEIGNIMNTLANQRAHLRNIEHIISHLSNIDGNGHGNGTNVSTNANVSTNETNNNSTSTSTSTNGNINDSGNTNTNGSRSIVTNAVFAIPFNSLQDSSQSQQISSIEDIMTTIINYSLNNTNNNNNITHVSDTDINRNSRLVTFESILDPINTECPITREPFISNQRVRLLTCGHIIDSEMFNQHINTSHVCPLCRFDLLH